MTIVTEFKVTIQHFKTLYIMGEGGSYTTYKMKSLWLGHTFGLIEDLYHL